MACRAAVRGLHDASRPLAVVFPATGLAVASGGVEPTHSFFVRVYETLSMHAHDRAANSFLRAQAIVRRADNGAAAPFVKVPVQRKSKTHAHVKHRSHARASRPRRHPASAAGAASSARAAATAAPAGASQAPRPSAASVGPPRGGGTSASNEFEFEGP